MPSGAVVCLIRARTTQIQMGNIFHENVGEDEKEGNGAAEAGSETTKTNLQVFE